MNTWPGGERRPISQSEHRQWNASEFPGTRQICSQCGEPTGRCEDDQLLDDFGQALCPECWQGTCGQDYQTDERI